MQLVGVYRLFTHKPTAKTMGTSKKPNALSREERKLMTNLSASRKVRDQKRQASKVNESAGKYRQLGREDEEDEDQLFRSCVNCVLFLILARHSVI